MLVDVERDEKGKLISVGGGPVPEHLVKIRIPPAWVNVQVETDPDAKRYVIGYDDKNRQQSIYSPHHTERAKSAKFERVKTLIHQADIIKARIEADLDGEHEEEAIIAYLIFEMGLRPGSTSDTKAEVDAFGATTLQGRHVKKMASGTVYLDFVGKKGVTIHQKVTNTFLIKELLIRKAYVGGWSKPIFETNNSALRKYLKSILGEEIQVKDLRTLKGTSVAMAFLDGKKIPSHVTKRKKLMREMIKKVASTLGNTPAIAKKSYIDPSVFEVFDID